MWRFSPWGIPYLTSVFTVVSSHFCNCWKTNVARSMLGHEPQPQSPWRLQAQENPHLFSKIAEGLSSLAWLCSCASGVLTILEQACVPLLGVVGCNSGTQASVCLCLSGAYPEYENPGPASGAVGTEDAARCLNRPATGSRSPEQHPLIHLPQAAGTIFSLAPNPRKQSLFAVTLGPSRIWSLNVSVLNP